MIREKEKKNKDWRKKKDVNWSSKINIESQEKKNQKIFFFKLEKNKENEGRYEDFFADF